MLTFPKGWLYAGIAALVLLSLHAGSPLPKTSPSAALGGTAYPSTVSAKSQWNLPLRSGMNLVSLPRSPASDDLNDLFGSTSEVELIFTFEGQRSRVALRDPETGNFIGTLRRYSVDNAYWIEASSSTTVSIDIPSSGDPGFPPARTGQWNLLPVLSGEALEDIPAGTEIDADAYLNDFRIAFGWANRRWTQISPDPHDDPDRLTDNQPAIEIGKGYWVLYEDDACICP